MFEIYREPAGDSAVIVRLVGSVSVENAEQLQQALLQDLQEQQHVMINCEQLTGIDFFIIQLLCSAHRSSVASNKLLTWHGKLPGLLIDAVTEAGFSRRNGCSLCPEGVFCMWSCKTGKA